MIIEINSFVNNINSNAQHDQEITLNIETVEVISYVNKIHGEISVPKKEIIEVTSYVSPINIETRQQSGSQKNETRTIITVVHGIQSNITITTKKIPVVYFAELFYIENPSFTEVIK